MQRLLIITLSLLYSCFALAKPTYQIDLILFAQLPGGAQNAELAPDLPLTPISSNAISLKPDTNKSEKPYNLLPASFSKLGDEYYQLSRKSRYTVLGHYSWRQPTNNQSTVALPFVDRNGWQLQGTLRVIQSSYYTFDADLQVSPPNNPHSSFTVSQKQRLKGDVVYYLDNERIGMLVKIHKLA